MVPCFQGTEAPPSREDQGASRQPQITGTSACSAPSPQNSCAPSRGQPSHVAYARHMLSPSHPHGSASSLLAGAGCLQAGARL